MLKGGCHCGAVSFEVKTSLEWITECNCSACRKLGTVWAHADEGEINVDMADGATLSYIWGDKTLAFHTCRTCGSTTHWTSLNKAESTRMAVNVKLVDPSEIRDMRLRHFDGADSWQYLD
ncbi:MAG: GFA family protein [Alphaproteobacteria bacterium]|nr:GFA family protein [Alphaproteobacteria bacterium]